MPRHEIVVQRIPDEFQGKRVHLPDPAELSHINTKTVGDYRASSTTLRHLCPSCDLTFDMSSLEPVFDAWGPDAVITVSLSCHWVPGEPRREPGEMSANLRKRTKRPNEERERDPDAGPT
jgi:hypothetical protein